MKIEVDCSKSIGELRRFWRSTGFTPAKLLLQPDMAQTLTYLGSIPREGIKHVRIHFLLDLLKAEGLETKSPVYDWTDMDRGMDALVNNGLQPFFELMGNPSGFFSDFCNDGQLHAWRRMVRDLANHLMDRYGADEVKKWYFETWNEPDVGWWHQWPEPVPFCNYYDACSEGLKDADLDLKFGGPGTCKHLSDLFKAVLAHCDSGTNYFTGQKGVRMDFISVHEKGAWGNKEDIDPDSRGITERELAVVGYIRQNHPKLADVPVMNNECDPIVGWKQTHTWRALPYYAAIIAKIINQHQQALIDSGKCDYALLSNDNGFLGEWGMRTHLVRFGDEKQLERGEFELVKKPSLTVMALLAMLGPEKLSVQGCGDSLNDAAGVMATKSGKDEVAVLLYNSSDEIFRSGNATISLLLNGLPFDACSATHYRIDEQHGNPFRIWADNEAKTIPDDATIAKMRDAQEVTALSGPEEMPVKNGSLSFDLDLPLPGVSLILLTRKPDAAPAKIAGLTATHYRGVGEKENVLLSWQAITAPGLRTYEVLFSESDSGPFQRINTPDLISSAFLHARRTTSGTGFYRIRAVDFWDRAGEESSTIEA